MRFLADEPLLEQLSLKERALSAVAQGSTLLDTLLPDNPIIYANRGFEKRTGYRIKDVLGKNCRFLQRADTDPDDASEVIGNGNVFGIRTGGGWAATA